MPQKKGTAGKTLASVERKSRTVVKKIGALEKTVLKDFKGAAWRTSTGINEMLRSAQNLASSKMKTARKKLASTR